MTLTLILLAAAVLIIAVVAALLLKSRQDEGFDTVPQNVLTRINAEYRDIR